KPEQFFAAPPSGLARYVYYRLSRGRVSLQLLDAPAAGDTPAEDVFERMMPHVRLSNGVYKTTFGKRFLNLDPEVNGLLSRHFPAQEPLVVEDWAASTCLTSCEWAKTLFPLFPKIRFAASDVVLVLIEITRPGRPWTFVA